MYYAKVLVLFIFSCTLVFCNHHHLLAKAFNLGGYGNPAASYHHIGDVAINCGSIGKSRAFDGREWIGDAGSGSGSGSESEIMSSLRLKGNSKSSTAVDKSFSASAVADPVPYKTSRISATPFHYKFQVTPGQKFIRLHFHHAPYHGFKDSVDFFTVKAGTFTLLHNFSPSLAAEAYGVNSLVKEFCLNVEAYTELKITFSPSEGSKLRKVHAFVNGIEIISMPTGLYYTRDRDFGARIVGMRNRFIVIDNSIALELIERLNTGGSFILSMEDFGLFRRWNGDFNYLIGTGVYQVSHPAARIKYTRVPSYLAPPSVYQTSWNMEPNVRRVQGFYTFRWRMPVDAGFGYLVRLHFCDFGSRTTAAGKKEFSVLVNGQIVETEIDVISWSGGIGVPVYRDYVVMMKGDRETGKYDLLIALRSTNELAVGCLSGLEIFKLSNSDDSLATPNLVFPRIVAWSWKKKIHELFALSQSNGFTTVVTVLLVLVNVIVYNLRQIWEVRLHKEKSTRLSPPTDPSFCCFSLSEIISATENFSDACLIGRGGFGKVYKGFITGISRVAAIKRLNASSRQGDREFRAEVETLSKFHHIHLVSLIGYCKEDAEMILVYEYMPCGTLADNIYRLGKESVPLSWEQRLKICIGAARGLEYLHTGTEDGYVIHRDVKDTNILLDENLVAKISDFGLSKVKELSESKSYIITRVKGTPGYIDPEYGAARKLNRKADVYAFGVVLLVVLCGRPAVDKNPNGLYEFLTSIFLECTRKGDLESIVDPSLKGRISPSSLIEFVNSVENCLHRSPKQRATMAQVAKNLQLALELQERTAEEEDVVDISLSFEGGTQCSQSPGVFPKEELITEKPDHLYHSGARFSIQDIQAATNSFSYGCEIKDARGRKAWLGFMQQLQKQVIVYEINFIVKTRRGRAVSEVYEEIEKLSKLRHENLQSLIGYCDEPEKFIVYEHIGINSLQSHIKPKTTNAPLSWKDLLNICIGVAEGLAYLQECTRRVENHYDLRPENVVLDTNLSPKISHFGLYRLNARLNSFGIPVPVWGESDLCSFGVLLVEVLFRIRLKTADECGGYQSRLQESIQNRTLHEDIDTTLEGKIAAKCLAKYLEAVLDCFIVGIRSTLAGTILKLKSALELQETAEAEAEAEARNEGIGSSSKDMYKEIKSLAHYRK